MFDAWKRGIARLYSEGVILKPIRDIFVCRDFSFSAHPQAICLDPISSSEAQSCALDKISSQGLLKSPVVKLS